MSGYGTAFTGTDIVLSVDNLWCDPCRDGGGSHKTGKKLIWYEVLLFCLSVLLPVTFYYLTYQEVHFVLLLWELERVPSVFCGCSLAIRISHI